MTIGLYIAKDGKAIYSKEDLQHLNLDQACEIAETEWATGRADYTRVTVNGETYCEFEN